MRETKRMRKEIAGVVAAVLLGFSAPLVAAEPPKGLDPEAVAVLKKATTYLAGLKTLNVKGHGTLEVVLTSGQKLQFDHDVTLAVQRPDKLRAVRKGEVADQVFVYDGKTLSLYSPEQKFYATKEAPPTLEGMLDFARDTLDIVAPAADLLYARAFDLLMEDMTAGFVVSRNSWFDGRSCTHAAFRKPGVDVQLWVDNGEKPLVYKYVLTTTDMAASPQYVLVLSGWETNPTIDGNAFRFVPPKDASRIDFLAAREKSVAK
jgi:hypothetical protein